MVPRILSEPLKAAAAKMPVVTLTGPRQSGKTTLAKAIFNHHAYVNLEQPEDRRLALDDPKELLARYPAPVIIDESHYAPELFSYIQIEADSTKKNGQFILTGSNNFLLMERITQSLSGRASILHLPPFCLSELENTKYRKRKWEDYAFFGFYPRIYDRKLDPVSWHRDYLRTYVERDVRLLVNVGDLRQFSQFLGLCAARIGQPVNLSSIGNDIGVSYQTIKRWLSILETSFIITLLPPFYKSYNKRITKAAKLYFNDIGLAAYLLGIASAAQLRTHFARGALFENLIIMDIAKSLLCYGIDPRLFFWRDSTGNEVDLLIEHKGRLSAVEIKSASTIADDFFKGLRVFRQISGIDPKECRVFYGGDRAESRRDGIIGSWRELANTIQRSYV